MLFAYVTGKETQDVSVKAYARGASAHILHIQDFLKNGIPPKATGVIFAGLLRGTSLLYTECLNRGLPYYYLDHAYFQAGYEPPGWMRVTRNGFVQNSLIPGDDTRWNRHFQRAISPYQHHDRQAIMLLPPSSAVKTTFSAESWRDKTIHQLRQHTNRPIIVREKSGPILAANGINTSEWKKYNYSRALEELLQTTYCVVTFNSGVAITALMQGIPVITTKYSAAWPISNRIENIEALVLNSRTPLMTSLSWGQYTTEEMRSGYAHQMVNSVRQVE